MVRCEICTELVCQNKQKNLSANKIHSFTVSYPPFGSAVSQRPPLWPRHRVGAPPRWEQSQGWAGPTGSSLRSTRPQLPAAACTGGALP